MKTLYLAEFSYGRGNLVSFKSDRETDKNYMVVEKSKKDILPNSYIYISSRVSKDKPIFETEHDALEWLADQAGNRVRSLSVQLSKAKSYAAELAQMRGD